MPRFWIAVVVAAAACRAGTASSPPPTPSSSAAAAAPAPRALPAPPVAAQNARIALAGGADLDAWIDVAIDGDAARAHALCELAVAQRLRVRSVKPDVRVVQACGPGALVPVRARARAVLLVTTERFDEDAAALEIATTPDRTAWDRGAPAAGTLVMMTRFADRAACERAADRLRGAHADAARDQAAAVRGFLADQLADARRRQTTACDEAREAAARCGQTPPHAACVPAAAAGSARACAMQGEIVGALERRANEPPPAATPPDVECRDE